MAQNIKTGSWVAWKWAAGMAEGQVIEKRTERTHIETKGKIVIRNGTVQNPALIVRHTSGSTVLKLLSEVRKVFS